MTQSSAEPVVVPSAPQGLDYQPALDGLRAISVVLVMLYHAGFSWMHGGFVGVEVFFVVSGYLITALMIEEQASSGRIALGRFWQRRARRLLPALLTMLVAVSAWTLLWGSTEQRSQMRRDLPWSLGYAANWGQIVGDVPYFAPSPPLLRHLWSLAVEEQWYVIWPLVAVGLLSCRLGSAQRVRRAALLGIVGLAIAGCVSWMATHRELTPQSTNFLYLSTPTRASGLLLGAALAFVWRPWSRHPATSTVGRRRGRAWLTPDVLGSAALASIGFAAFTAAVTDVQLYQWMLSLVSTASAAAVIVVTHPASTVFRPLLATRPLVAVGRRSYGLYLWSWPISRIVGAFHGSWSRFALAMVITAVVNELCFRLIETPIRRGALGAWASAGSTAVRRRRRLTVALVAAVPALIGVIAFARQPQTFDAAQDQSSEEVTFGSSSTGSSGSSSTGSFGSSSTGSSGSSSTGSSGSSSTGSFGSSSTGSFGSSSTVSSGSPPTAPANSAGSVLTVTAITAAVSSVTTTTPPGPIRIVLVGDSQAHSLAVNVPTGLDAVASLADGGIDGCSIADTGIGRSAQGSKRRFETCAGWAQRWARSAAKADAEVAVVMIGAWDVLDVDLDGTLVVFGTPAHDRRILDGLQAGIDAVAATGAKVALLEVACMRPVDAAGAAVPPLPERGDDRRVAHLNELLRQAARSNPTTTTFLGGPPAWCHDPMIATDTAYRWDGVHVYRRGAKLILETIIPELRSIVRR